MKTFALTLILVLAFSSGAFAYPCLSEDPAWETMNDATPQGMGPYWEPEVILAHSTGCAINFQAIENQTMEFTTTCSVVTWVCKWKDYGAFIYQKCLGYDDQSALCDAYKSYTYYADGGLCTDYWGMGEYDWRGSFCQQIAPKPANKWHWSAVKELYR